MQSRWWRFVNLTDIIYCFKTVVSTNNHCFLPAECFGDPALQTLTYYITGSTSVVTNWFLALHNGDGFMYNPRNQQLKDLHDYSTLLNSLSSSSFSKESHFRPKHKIFCTKSAFFSLPSSYFSWRQLWLPLPFLRLKIACSNSRCSCRIMFKIDCCCGDSYVATSLKVWFSSPSCWVSWYFSWILSSSVTLWLVLVY